MFERLQLAPSDAAGGDLQANFVRPQGRDFDIRIFQLVKRGVTQRTHGRPIGVPLLASQCKGEGDEKTRAFS